LITRWQRIDDCQQHWGSAAGRAQKAISSSWLNKEATSYQQVFPGRYSGQKAASNTSCAAARLAGNENSPDMTTTTGLKKVGFD
jgi:hypothetical protein